MRKISWKIFFILTILLTISACVIITDPAQAAPSYPPRHSLEDCIFTDEGGYCEGVLDGVSPRTYRLILDQKIKKGNLVFITAEIISPEGEISLKFEKGKNAIQEKKKTEDGFLLKQKTVVETSPVNGSLIIYWQPESKDYLKRVQYKIAYRIESGLLKDGK